MLTSEEWDLIYNLILILHPFAKVTEILGESNYYTYSIMNPILIEIKKQFHPTISYGIAVVKNINFNNNEIAFDENIIIEDDKQLLQPINYNSLIDKIKLNFFAVIDYY